MMEKVDSYVGVFLIIIGIFMAISFFFIPANGNHHTNTKVEQHRVQKISCERYLRFRRTDKILNRGSNLNRGINKWPQ
jgi:hypothetical protein